MAEGQKRGRLTRALRDTAAGLLAVSLLCALMVPAMAVSIKMPSAGSVNRPAVVVEGNAVVDSNGQYTGFFELSLKVRTTFYYDTDGNPVDDPALATTKLDHPFVSATVALRYDAALLTPVSWTYTDENGQSPIDVSAATVTAPIGLDTKKPDDGTVALAEVEGYTGNDPSAENRSTALLTLYARSKLGNVSYAKETAVCVVRFKYDKSALKLDATNSYPFLRPMEAPAGRDGEKACVVWFAADGDAADSSAGQSVWYQGKKSKSDPADTYFYHYLKAPSLSNGLPDTAGSVVLATGGSYDANLLSVQSTGGSCASGSVQFKLVNSISYASGGVNLDNLATILFYDWDNTLISVLTVEKGDARAAVNAHVEKTMIYPDLRASKHPGDAGYMDSLDRKYTYRGTYPAEGPSGGTTVTDGDEFVLSNKLDYAFYRRPTKLVEPDPGDPTAAHWDVASNAAAEKAYPYVNGWAVVADIKNIEKVWTTFGVGELKDANPAAAGGRYTTAGTKADYFKLEDFSNLTPGIHYVKACYEPGTLLMDQAYYRIIDGPHYSRYSMAASTGEATYSIQYKYSRTYSTTEGMYGVSRTREPAVRLQITPDIMKNDIQNSGSGPFYSTVAVKNTEIVDVDLTVSGTVWGVGYTLVDVYGETIATGSGRSQFGNEMDIPNNFNYNFVGEVYANRQGTDGFVYRATLNTLLAEGTKAVRGETNTFSAHANLDTFLDLNLRADSQGQEFNDLQVDIATAKILDAIQKAYDHGLVNTDGDVVLDWHQLQYHIINYDTGGILQDGRILTPAECGGFSWCRLDNCGGNGPTTVTNFQDLLLAGYKAYVESVSSPAMEGLTLDKVNSFFLRKDAAGVEFADIDAFKTAFAVAISKLAAGGGYSAATISTADWIELQHLLIPGKTYQKAATLRANPAVDYWWEGGRTPGISDLSRLLTAAYRVYVDGGVSADLEGLTMAVVDAFSLRADVGGHKFAALDTFVSALRTAVQKLHTGGFYDAANIGSATWEELQYALIHGDYESPPIVEDYWWKNGDTPDINEFSDLAYVGYRVYVDGNDPSMLDKLFSMSAVTNTPMWLRANSGGGAFLSVAKVKEALEKAAKALQAAGKTADDMRTLTWLEFQHVMLDNPYKSDAELQVDTAAGSIDYWWYNGGAQPLKTFSALLEAANKAAEGDGSLLDALTIDALNSAAIGLRKSFDGTAYTAGDLDAFKTQITAMAAAAKAAGKTVTSLTWNEVQYYLIHGFQASSATAADKEGTPYYWWYNGGTGTPTPITAGVTQENLVTLLEAAYRAGVNGNPGAWNNLTTAMTETFRLVKDKGTATAWDDLTKYDAATLRGFKAAMEALVRAVGTSYKEVNWFQVQHYLLTGDYLLATDTNLPTAAVYWWKDNSSDPNAGGTTPLDEFLEVLTNFAASDMGAAATDTLKDAVNSYYNSAKLGIRVRTNATAAIVRYEDSSFTETYRTQVKTRVTNLAKALKNNKISPYYNIATGEINLTWYQLQYYSFNMNNILATATSIVSPADAYNYYLTLGSHDWAPDWAATDLPASFAMELMEQEDVGIEHSSAEEPLMVETPAIPEENGVPDEPEIVVGPEVNEIPAIDGGKNEDPSFVDDAATVTELVIITNTALRQMDAIAVRSANKNTGKAFSAPLQNGAAADAERRAAPPSRLAPREVDTRNIVGGDPAALPPPRTSRHQISSCRRTLRRKKMPCPAYQGGINV